MGFTGCSSVLAGTDAERPHQEVSQEPPFTTISLSGTSSTGKTTFIALLLETLIQKAPIPVLYINEDAFFKEVDELPVVGGIPDNDALHGLHITSLRNTIRFAQENLTLPDSYQPFPWLKKSIDEARKSLSPDFVNKMNRRLEAAQIDWTGHRGILFVEGFLLYYHHQPGLTDLFDHKLFLLASYEEAKRRRLQRYIDRPLPPEAPRHFATEAYFDDFVWAHYVEYHKYLFAGPINKGILDAAVVEEEYGIFSPGTPELDREATLAWAFERTLSVLKQKSRHISSI